MYWLQRVREEPRPLRFLLSRLLFMSGLCRLFIIRRDKYILRFFPTSLSMSYWYDSSDRLDDEKVISSLLRNGDAFIDVGANVGALSLCAAAHVGADGQVYSFEPHPRTCHYLECNVALNQATQIRIFNLALGDAPGTVAFSDRRSDDMNRIDKAGKIQVEVKCMDDVIPDTVGAIALLKIDVEGNELPVLRGAQATLSRTRAVYFESDDKRRDTVGYGTAEIINFLNECGFSVYRQYGNHWKETPGDHKSECCENLLAQKKGTLPANLTL